MRLAAGPLGVAPFTAMETLSDGIASLGVVVSPFAPQTSFRAERYRVERAQQARYCVTTLFFAPPVRLGVVPDDAWVDASIGVRFGEPAGGVIQLPSFTMKVLPGLDYEACLANHLLGTFSVPVYFRLEGGIPVVCQGHVNHGSVGLPASEDL